MSQGSKTLSCATCVECDLHVHLIAGKSEGLTPCDRALYGAHEFATCGECACDGGARCDSCRHLDLLEAGEIGCAVIGSCV